MRERLAGAILALDPATKTGIAAGQPGGTPYLTTVNFGRDLDDAEDVFARAIRWCERELTGTLPSLIAVERQLPPSRAINDNAVITIGLEAIFIGFARARGIPLRRPMIATWRKYFLGRGDLKRADAKAAAKRLCRGLRWDAADDNAAEAGGIWLWACAQVDPRVVQRSEPLFVAGGDDR